MNKDASNVEALIAERDELKAHCEKLQALVKNVGWPPGHFYSPIVDAADANAMRAVRDRLSADAPAGVEVDSGRMSLLLDRLAAHHGSFSFSRNPDSGHRFFFDNPFFGCHDASVYFAMLMEFRPHRVIEVGAGFSSRLLLDTNERFFAGEIEVTLIDPSLDGSDLRAPGATALLRSKVQDAPIAIFDRLAANDILFIDSSHVCKTGSDVNYYLFEILPRLRPGILVHIHDILYPFEYPESWVIGEKRSWNEAYLLRAFLQYNAAFEIVYWNNFVYHRLTDRLRRLMPLCMENEGGSLWLRRI